MDAALNSFSGEPSPGGAVPGPGAGYIHQADGIFRLLFEQTADALLLLDVRSNEFVDCNEAATRMLGYPAKAGMLPLHPATLSPERQPDGRASREKADEMIATARQRGSHRFEWIHCSPHRKDFPVEVLLTPILLEGHEVILTTWRDITERKQAEVALLRMNRTLQLISACNAILVRATTEQGLLDSLCRLVVERGGYLFGWVAFAEHDPARSVRVAAQSGSADGYLGAINLTWADSALGQGPVGRAIRTGRPQITRDTATDPDFAPWRAEALKRGFFSVIALPLKDSRQTFGALTLYGPELTKINDEEITLLTELADDMAFGLTSLRAQTDHARTKDQLLLLQAALEAAPNSVMLTDTQGTIQWVNPAFTINTGYTLAEAVGQNPRLLKSGRHPAAYYAGLWRTILSGHNWRGEFVNRRKNGELYTEDVTIAPIRDAAGVIRHFVAIKFDITARRQTEAAHQRLAAIIESTTDFVGQADPGGRLTYLNTAGLRLLGYDSFSQVAGHPISDFHLPESAARILQEAIPAALRDGAWTGETVLRTRDGRLIPASQVVIVGHSPDGSVTHYSTIIRDLTERKQAESRLLEQAAIIDHSPIAIIITDLANRITYCNQGALQLYGLSREELLNHTAEDVLTAETMVHLGAGRTAALTHGRWSGEVPVVTKTGRKLQAEFLMALIHDDTGRPTARLSIATDITEKKKLQEQFFRAQRLESLGMLASGIAHDLNNVLTPILMAGPMLRTRATNPLDVRLLETIEHSAERGAGLVRQILSFAHGTAGEPRLLQVKHVLRDIIGLIEETFPKSIQLEQDVPNDLWSISANPTQIHQIMLNLCVNARDAMPHGGTLSLTTANCLLDVAQAAAIPGARPGPFVVIKVGDNGSGIPPEVFARIWEPFFTTKGEGKGTGLGLSTVRGIVENHRGFITVQTKVGAGTAFEVYLPAAEEDEADGHESRPPFVPRGNGELLLVVDDEAANRDVTHAILARHGYRVLVAASGSEAVSVFIPRAGEISLVVTDVHMPTIDGAALSHILLRLKPGLRILAMSGLSNSGRTTTEELGRFATDFLAKPFKPEALLIKVHALLQRGAPPSSA